MPFQNVIKRAKYFVDGEIDIIQMDLEHPDRFLTFPYDHAPLARWNGQIAELLEYLIPPQASGKISMPSGEPMAYADVVGLCESVLGISVAKPHDVKMRLLSRKKNITPFIDLMRFALREASEKMYM